jgi:hypothetical protein
VKVRTKQKRPYKLNARATLDAAPPFSVERVREMLKAAQAGPKAGRASSHPEPSAEAVRLITSILNARHSYYYAAQQDRARKDRRDRAKLLVDELRQITPAICADAEQQLIKNDPFSHNAFAAASALHEFLSSDVPVRALPQMTVSAFGWQWTAPSLAADLTPLIGKAGAARFIASTAKLLTGESPKPSAVAMWLKQQTSR